MRVASDVSPVSPCFTSSMIHSRFWLLVVGLGVGCWLFVLVFVCLCFSFSSESWLLTSSNKDVLDDRQCFTARSATFFLCVAERASKPCRSSRAS